MSTPFLSIIIPAYNEETRLPGTLENINSFIRRQSYLVEVLVVENGSQDATLQIAEDFARSHSNFRALHVAERGKGLAVQRGMLEAAGEYRFMCDADLSMPVEQIARFLPPALGSYDIAIASREAPGAVRYHEPFYRHFGGRLINLMIRVLALPGLQDTQCGFKSFHASTAETLFRRMTLTGWAFDIEVLYIARQLGIGIIEVPIDWYFNPESKLNLFRDAFKMMADLLTIRRNARLGRYDSARLERVDPDRL